MNGPEPVTVTICGSPSRETLANLLELAITAGLGLVLQPRQTSTPLLLPAPEVVSAEPVTRRKVKNRPAKPARAKSPGKAVQSAPATKRPPDKAAAAARRDSIVAALRRVGDTGLSFKGLLGAMSAHLALVGDNDQQVAALRNALSELKRTGRVDRVAGQWVATS
jgi:hypothetical protein